MAWQPGHHLLSMSAKSQAVASWVYKALRNNASHHQLRMAGGEKEKGTTGRDGALGERGSMRRE